jgi:alpha-mannosidase
VSLLRGPTWPDPGADNGLQRQRLALMPVPAGWRGAGVPRQARRFREPLWCRPHGGEVPAAPLFPSLEDDLEPVALRPAEGGGVVLALQNLGPCRRRWDPGPDWRITARLDGLDEPLEGAGAASAAAVDRLDLGPWDLGFWRLERTGPGPLSLRDRRTDR